MKFIKMAVFVAVFIFLFIIFPKYILAIENPLALPNNKYGIHILDTAHLEEASDLVNSSGGDWGYVTLVIRRDERDILHWQKVFDEMRRQHLIPIIRIATKTKDDSWEKLKRDDIKNWVYFLNSLNWVVENRYIVVGNEVNHANEWGGEVNPEEYSNYLADFSKTAKDASKDFFIIPAGLDASAPTNDNYMSEEIFIRRLFENNPELKNYIDGWASHSYPNPNFSGSENDTGRGSIRTFQWEMNLLQSLGIQKILPIFITETGWAHNTGDKVLGYSNTTDIGQKFMNAYKNAWNDNRIVAVTPFVLSYSQEPFSVFSWKDKEGKNYPFYDDIKSMPKIKGEPKQITDGEIVMFLTPRVTTVKNKINALIGIKNKGQDIWDGSNITVETKEGSELKINSPVKAVVEPNQIALVPVTVNTPGIQGYLSGKLQLKKNDMFFGNEYIFQINFINPTKTIWDKVLETKRAIEGIVIKRIRGEN